MTARAGYDPGAIVTPANLVTFVRILFTVPWCIAVADQGATWLTFLWGLALGVTDNLDGYLARRQGTTRSGAFLDPLADKVLVLGGMGVLAASGRFLWLPVLLIAARELLVSVVRSRAARVGVSVPARRLAKWKTFVQGLAIGAALIPTLDGRADWIADSLLWAAVALTWITGLDYLRDGRRLVREGAR